MVIRNAGGRVPPDAVRDLAFICYMTEMMSTDAGPLFEVAVIHHTQCGTGFLADEGFRHSFADRIGADEAVLAAIAVTDPEATVRSDVELLRSSPLLSTRISVSGHVYDVATGLVQTVIPASPMHSSYRKPAMRSKPVILLALLLAAFILNLDTTMVNVALPTLARDLHATNSQLQWVIDAYNLVFASLLLTAGSLSDRFGRKGMLIAGLLSSGRPASPWRIHQ